MGKKLIMNLPKNVHGAFKHACVSKGKTMSYILRKFIVNYSLAAGTLNIDENLDFPVITDYKSLVEDYLGRCLNPEEIIHHINEKHNDNRLENFYLCKNQAEHGQIHACLNRGEETVSESNLRDVKKVFIEKLKNFSLR